MTKIKAPIIWALTEYDVNHTLLAQKFQLEVQVRFVSAISDASTDIDRSTDFTAPNPKTVQSNAIMTVRIDNLPRDVAIQLKRTPSRLLRVGNQLVIHLSGQMEWISFPEKAKGTIVPHFEDLEYVSEDTLVS